MGRGKKAPFLRKKSSLQSKELFYLEKGYYIPLIHDGQPVAEAIDWNGSDGEGRKLGERLGLDTKRGVLRRRWSCEDFFSPPKRRRFFPYSISKRCSLRLLRSFLFDKYPSSPSC